MLPEVIPSVCPKCGGRVSHVNGLDCFGWYIVYCSAAGHVGKAVGGVKGVLAFDGLVHDRVAVIKPRAFHCSDPLCPVCCYDWAKKQVKRALARFEVFESVFVGFELRHVTVSVPESDWMMDFGFLKRQVIALLQVVGVVGGLLMFHPKRYNRRSKIWYFSPHFHALGFVEGGFLDGGAVRLLHNLSGYVVKNLDRRKSVVGTLLYQLSHCGIPFKGHSVVWFGELRFLRGKDGGLRELMEANLKQKVVLSCPVCGGRLVHVCRNAKAPPHFDYVGFEECFVFDDVDNWSQVFIPHRKGKASKSELDAYDEYESSFG